ncbi:HIT family protein [Pseudalkalibacillus hwajinpoensis]|uniref:HIT family protein n=1 Tax=Guptibacillus hwajinpoensis TaxID=208199 RepID=UPI001CFE9D15|nr:HIT domain-containing protein [Pseudalkalibacillus hwajinpoensis]
MEKCVICEKHNQNLNSDMKIYEDDYSNIFHGPLTSGILGYLYIEPKRHVENYYEFSDQEVVEINSLVKKVTKMLTELLEVDRIYTVIISEAVRHQHFHLIPRTYEMELKGLDLIEQATQQKSIKPLDKLSVDKLIESLVNKLNT